MTTTSHATRREVRTEVLANLFQAVVDEMAWIVIRSAHTTFIKETQDFGACLVTPQGEMFAYPYTSCATSLIGVPMGQVLSAIDWLPGDILATNDPYTTAGMVMHLNDFYLIRPVFSGGELLCFLWGFLHLTDVGGYAPGSIDMRNDEVFQEGLRLRPTMLFRADELNEDLWGIIADNSRIPGPNFGDVMALVSALRRGAERMHGLVKRYGAGEVGEQMAAVLDATEAAARHALSSVPPGEYHVVDFFEDDYSTDVPVRLELCLRVADGSSIVLDYRGSDPQVQAALNLPTGGQTHHPFLSLAVTNFVVTRSPTIHVNAGIQRCVELVLPEGSVVNCEFPAACGMRWSTAMRLHDLTLAALNAALPRSVPAAGAGQVVVTYVSTVAAGRAGRVVVANPVVGGTGGGPELDGESGIDFPCAFLRNVPVEVLEAEVPVVVQRFGIVPDSEGAGRFRGGFGVEYAFTLGDPRAVVVMRGKDRHRFVPWGVAGGTSGSVGDCFVITRDGRRVEIGKTTVYRATFGDTVHIRGSGGGGYGDPNQRDAEAVACDVADGRISAERASELYGVVTKGAELEREATALLRAERPPRPSGAVDVGAARAAFEQQLGPLSAELSRWLPTLPTAVRYAAKLAAYGIARAALEGGAETVDVEGTLAAARDEIDGGAAAPSPAR